MKRLLYFLLINLAIIGGGKSVFAQAQTDTLKTVIIKVSGISCNGDMPLIKKKLINQDGIEDVSYTEASKGKVTFTIQYHSVATSEEKIKKFIESAPSCDDPNTFPYKTKIVVPKHKPQ